MSDHPLAQVTEGLTEPVSKVAIALIDKIGRDKCVILPCIWIAGLALMTWLMFSNSIVDTPSY